MTYVAPGGKYSVDLFAQNLTNKAVYNGGDQNPILGGLSAATIGAPRVLGGRIASISKCAGGEATHSPSF